MKSLFFITQKQTHENPLMSKPLRVAVLVDLPRSPLSGGHVKGWERRARAAAKSDLPLDLTVYFSGSEAREDLSPHVRLRQLPPVFSTAKLKFLPYVPDHTDLAPFHPALAKELGGYDVIHTTDAFFAFARTAEKVSRKHGIPLVTSFHTDTPSYAKVFTRKTIETIFGQNGFSRFLTDTLKLPEKQEKKMLAKLRGHLKACSAALVIRQEDRKIAEEILGAARVHDMHIGADKEMFGPHRKDRAGIEKDYGVPAGRIVFLFVGRMDEGKNIYTLIEAMEKLIAQGENIHLITAGIGPAEEYVKEKLGARATVAGFVAPEELARLYASVDALAMPSEVEIRSQAGMEALVSGLPVLVSEKSGVAPSFDNTEAMARIESGAENWTKAIKDFTNDSGKRAAMAETALAYSRANIAGWEDVMRDDFLAVWLRSEQRRLQN